MVRHPRRDMNNINIWNASIGFSWMYDVSNAERIQVNVVSPVSNRPTKRHKKLEIISNYQSTPTNQGPVEQCTIEENIAYVGATLDSGNMRIKYIQSGTRY